MDHAVKHLRSEGTTIANEDLEHLSPLQHEQINLHGRYVFSAPDHLRHGPLFALSPLTAVASANPARLLPGGRGHAWGAARWGGVAVPLGPGSAAVGGTGVGVWGVTDPEVAPSRSVC